MSITPLDADPPRRQPRAFRGLISALTEFCVPLLIGSTIISSWLYFILTLHDLWSGISSLAAAIFSTIFARRRAWQFSIGVAESILPSVRSRFRLVVFRSFGETHGAPVRLILLPVIGCFGEIAGISNRTLEDAEPGDDYPDLALRFQAGVDWEVLERSSDDQWREMVRRRIDFADAAVVDVSDVSDNLAWEIDQCIEHFPPWRILVAVNADADSSAVWSNPAVQRLTEYVSSAGMSGAPFSYSSDGALSLTRLRWRMFLWCRRLSSLAIYDRQAPSESQLRWARWRGALVTIATLASPIVVPTAMVALLLRRIFRSE